MTENNNTTKLKSIVVDAMLERKGLDIKVLDLRELEQSVADYFIICHGTSTTQVNSIADFIERQTRSELQEHAIHKEGNNNSQWILLDYGDVVAHVFLDEIRDFYKLEDLWADAKIESITEE